LDEVIELLPEELPPEEVEASVGLSDEEIRALCEEEYRKAEPSQHIVTSWKLALRQYFLEPDGNEQEDLSKVQSSDVRDAVEGALPILMDMFLGADSPVVFKPNHERDIDQAEMETIFCQYVLNTQNPGLLIILQWIKDALLLKNGYVKVFWDAAVNEEREDYHSLGADEFAQLLADDDYEVIDVVEQVDPDLGVLVSVAGKRRSDAGQVRIVNIPTDHVRVSGTWNSIDFKDCPYICHEEQCSRSDLVVDGFDREMVDGLPAENSLPDDTDLSYYRNNQNAYKGNSTSSDHSRDTLTRYEHYIRADRNGDGITELLKVTIIGRTGGTVLDIEEVDEHVIVPITPYVIPHNPMGMSLAEFVAETQKIQTATLRQTMDNLYISNQPGIGVDVNNLQNPEVLSQSRVGQIYLKKNNGQLAETIAVPFMADKSLMVMQAVDQMAEKKTGLSAETTGLDAEALSKSTNMVGAMALNQSQLRMRLVMSTLCETGFKPLMLKIRGLVMKNMKRQEMVELGGRWVPMNPRNWREQRSTQIRIGVGSVLKAEKMASLNAISSLQKEIVAQQGGIEGPFVTAKNIYNTLREYEKMTGTMSVDRFFSNPDNWSPPPPPENIASEALEIEEAKVIAKANKDAADVELKGRELAIKEREVGIKEQQAVTQRVAARAKEMTEVARAVAQPRQ